MTDTKELECVDFILRADAMRHPALEAMVARLNASYKETHALMEKQSSLMHAMFEPGKPFEQGDDVDINALDARIEAVWNECFDALERMVQPSGKAG